MAEPVAELPQTLPKPKQKRSRRITEQDAIGLAQLIGEKNMTDLEACQKLGYSYQGWLDWKCRNKHVSRFNDVLARVRAETIHSAIENIKSFEAKDWRASLARLQLLDPNRFSTQARGDQAQPVVVNTTVNVLLQQMYGEAKQLTCGVQATTGGVQPTKQIGYEAQDKQTPVNSDDRDKSK